MVAGYCFGISPAGDLVGSVLISGKGTGSLELLQLWVMVVAHFCCITLLFLSY